MAPVVVLAEALAMVGGDDHQEILGIHPLPDSGEQFGNRFIDGCNFGVVPVAARELVVIDS